MLCDVIYIEFIYLLLQHYHYCHWHEQQGQWQQYKNTHFNLNVFISAR